MRPQVFEQRQPLDRDVTELAELAVRDPQQVGRLAALRRIDELRKILQIGNAYGIDVDVRMRPLEGLDGVEENLLLRRIDAERVPRLDDDAAAGVVAPRPRGARQQHQREHTLASVMHALPRIRAGTPR